MAISGPLPDPALVVLIGPSGSGKSTWAQSHYRTTEIVSSDQLRGVVGSGPADLAASKDAFGLLDTILAARGRRGLTTVVDTLGLDPERRRGYLALARASGLPAVAVLLDTEPAVCRARNAVRDRPVPAPALAGQLARMRAVVAEVDDEGWDVVARADPVPTAPTTPAGVTIPPVRASAPAARGQLEFVLQISRFPWGADPGEWLRLVAGAAAEAGFTGLALMDHLIQIPQVGRAWDPIPDPFVTLGFLAGSLGSAGLRLGTLVSPVTFRAPGILAKTVATLDVLTDGRAFCGLGAGWWDREHRAYGLPFPTPAQRLDQLETCIETVRALWAPGTKAYVGERVSLPETTCYPRPAGTVPIIVGGGGERRTLRIAARLADACNLPADLETLDQKVAVLRRHCSEVGRPPDDVAVTVLDVPVIGTDRDQVAGTVERLRGRTAAATFARRHHAGTVADQIVRYRALADRGVRTVFLALPDLAGPEQVLGCSAIPAAFR